MLAAHATLLLDMEYADATLSLDMKYAGDRLHLLFLFVPGRDQGDHANLLGGMVANDHCISLQLWVYIYFVVPVLTYNVCTGDLQTQS